MTRRRCWPVLLAFLFAASAHAAEPTDIPDNLGGGLGQLVAAGHGVDADSAAMLRPMLPRDDRDRVLVNIWLDGTRALASVDRSLAERGIAVHAELPSHGRGVIAAYIPIERAAEIARLPGVRSVMLERRPLVNRGKATTQGRATIHADRLNALGLQGAGVTIAALSDSFDTAGLKDDAAADIRSNDLPGPANPAGNTRPVYVLDEDPYPGTDEGRAILQIVYDIAPKSKLCFATAYTGEVQFAANILRLADPRGKCGANVIVDDVGYQNEPYFSDGVLALAVDQVAADGVAYFSVAGNQNNGDYSASFAPVGDAAARSKYAGPLLLGGVPAALTGGGFHNFGTAKDVHLALPIEAPPGGHYLTLQWDDPFNAYVTASYDLLVFDAKGRYRADLSGADNAYSTGQPLQNISLPGGGAGTLYYVAIALRGGYSAPHAQHLKMIDEDDSAQVSLLEFANPLAPAVVGHPAATGAIAVAADYWDNIQGTEYYSSLGPTAIWLDANNLPLAKAEIRLKPEIAAPDGVDNTFLGTPRYPGDPHPLFFGTSAAAPHAAAAAALLIEAAGGPGRLTPSRLRTLLEGTTQQPHQLTPGAVSARLGSGADTLTVDVSGFLYEDDPGKFRFAFRGAKGDSVTRIVLNAAPDDISFGDKTDKFLIGATNMPAGDIDYVNDSGFSPTATLDFKRGAFADGVTVDLGLDFVNTQVKSQGKNAALLHGTSVTATLDVGGKVTTVTGALGGRVGRGYSVADGYGLIDAYAAYLKLKAGKPAETTGER